jgi:hypothetical protein
MSVFTTALRASAFAATRSRAYPYALARSYTMSSITSETLVPPKAKDGPRTKDGDVLTMHYVSARSLFFVQVLI